MIAIVGGGPAGCLLALLLARRGRRVQVFERRADPRVVPAEAGRSINLALAARGKHALQQAGVLAALQPFLVPMPGRQLHLADGSERFDAYGQHAHEINHSMSRAELTRQLVVHAGREPNVALHFGQRCIGLSAAGALQLHDETSGRQYEVLAERVIGADGAGSALRKALTAAGQIASSNALLEHDYKELSIPPANGGAALRNREALHIWPRRGHMLIALPNADHSFTATLFMPRTGPQSFAALATPPAAREFFAREFPDALQVMPAFDHEFATHRQGVLGTVHCTPWHVGERALLIGDAAHAIVPFHGQGLNCALEDCRILDTLLADGGEAPFARFATLRGPDAAAIAQMSLDNYAEMRDEVLDPRHQQQRLLELELERRHPHRFIPRYAMVMFHHDIGYAAAQARGRVQQQILDVLWPESAAAAPYSPAAIDWQQAADLIERRLPSLQPEGPHA